MIVCMYVICVHEIDVFLFCHLCICTFPFCVLCVCLCMLVCACVCERFWEVHPSERGVSFNCVEVLEGGWCRPHDSSVLFYPPLVCDCRSWTIAALGSLVAFWPSLVSHRWPLRILRTTWTLQKIISSIWSRTRWRTARRATTSTNAMNEPTMRPTSISHTTAQPTKQATSCKRNENAFFVFTTQCLVRVYSSIYHACNI